MRMLLRLAFMACLSQAAVADTVFKCTDSGGRTVFSDKACAADAEKIEFIHAESYYEKTMRESAERKQEYARREEQRAKERIESDRLIYEMRRKHDALCAARKAQVGLFIGMQKASIFEHESWGYPDDTTKTTSSQGVKEYLVYKCDGYPSVRMFVTNGRLSSIHN